MYPLNLKNLLVRAMNAMQYKAPLFLYFKITYQWFSHLQNIFWSISILIVMYEHKVQKTQKFSSFDFIIFTFILSLQKLIKYILSYFIELDPYLQERSYFYSYTLSTIYNITRYFGQKFQMQHQTFHFTFHSPFS
jgi:hypothetical protein